MYCGDCQFSRLAVPRPLPVSLLERVSQFEFTDEFLDSLRPPLCLADADFLPPRRPTAELDMVTKQGGTLILRHPQLVPFERIEQLLAAQCDVLFRTEPWWHRAYFPASIDWRIFEWAWDKRRFIDYCRTRLPHCEIRETNNYVLCTRR